MKKYILSTTLTLMAASVFAQDYGYSYNYNEYQNSYDNQLVQAAEPNYYENQQYMATGNQQSYDYAQTTQEDRKWDLSITTGAHYSAEYKGGNSSETKLFIAPTAEYRLDPWQKLYLSLDEGAGYSYDLTNNVVIGGGLGYREGRDSKDATILSGMQDIDDTLTYVAFAKYKINSYDFGVKLEKGADSSNDGLTTELSAGYKTKLTPKFLVGTKISAIYGDDTYMKQNFGVSTAQAISGRAAHNTDAGFSEAKLKVYGNYNIAGPHNIMGSVGYSKLLGDAKDSTVVKDDTDVSMAVGYSYIF